MISPIRVEVEQRGWWRSSWSSVPAEQLDQLAHDGYAGRVAVTTDHGRLEFKSPQTAAALFGEDPPSDADARLGRALGNLDRAGWRFMSIRNDEGFVQPLDAAEAYQYLTGQRNTNLRSGDRLLLLKPEHQDFSNPKTYFHVVDKEEVGAVDFFRATGDPEVVARPELARQLKTLEGFEVGMRSTSKRYPFHRGALQAYLGYCRESAAEFSYGGTPLGPGPLKADQLDQLGPLGQLEQMDPVARKDFLTNLLLGANPTQALASLQPAALEQFDTHLVIDGISIDINQD
ncbi:MAG: hypothetical protein KC910_20385 [Candidatus Eremiobacteraeota bacterium]|nr:hypothetical protein [Candidatus Eremiobacteraeota bacterium]